MSDWISVDERLPAHDGVKGCDAGCSVIVDIYADDERWADCYYSFEAKEWFDCDLHCSIDCVTHWMPLPEPPKKPEAEFNTKQEG